LSIYLKLKSIENLKMGAKFWIGVVNDYQIPILLFVVSLGFTAGWFGRDSNDPDYLPCYAPKEMGEDP